jgi:hypothetical protein
MEPIMEPSDRKLGPEVSMAPPCGCYDSNRYRRTGCVTLSRRATATSTPQRGGGANGGALRLDGDFRSVVVKLLPVLAQPAQFTLPSRPHRPQQPPEGLLMARLAKVTQLVDDDVVQDVGGCEQQVPRERERCKSRSLRRRPNLRTPRGGTPRAGCWMALVQAVLSASPPPSRQVIPSHPGGAPPHRAT